MTIFSNIDKAAQAGAHGENAFPLPTQAQADAGNYKKGRTSVQGIPIVIENPRGSMRHWSASDGTSGANLMKFHYGYFAGVIGADGDELDCFVGPWPEGDTAYVINQFMRGGFDEHKVMLGFPDKRTAEAGYLSNFTAGWQGLDSCITCSISQLKSWLANGNKSRPLTQDQLPFEERKDMDKVIWDSANVPLGTNLDKVLYQIRSHDGPDGLIFDGISMAEILADSDGVLRLDALVLPYRAIETRMAVLQKVMDRTGGGVKTVAMQVSEPFTQKGTTNIAVIFELSDGQTAAIFFHNPDVTPKRIASGDELVSWKWMLNKKDVTIAVAPERGRDLNIRNVAARIMALAEKNSPRFVAANSKRAERMQTIEGLKQTLTEKEAELERLNREIEVAEVDAENRPATLPAADLVTKVAADDTLATVDSQVTEGEAQAVAEAAATLDPAEVPAIAVEELPPVVEAAPILEPVAIIEAQPEPVIELAAEPDAVTDIEVPPLPVAELPALEIPAVDAPLVAAAELEATVEIAAANPEKDAATAFLQSVIDGTAALDDSGVPTRLTDLYSQYGGESDVLDLFRSAVKAYSSYAISKANAALAK